MVITGALRQPEVQELMHRTGLCLCFDRSLFDCWYLSNLMSIENTGDNFGASELVTRNETLAHKKARLIKCLSFAGKSEKRPKSFLSVGYHNSWKAATAVTNISVHLLYTPLQRHFSRVLQHACCRPQAAAAVVPELHSGSAKHAWAEGLPAYIPPPSL